MTDAALDDSSLQPARHTSATWIRDESLRIQTLRGLACVLLVAFHVIGSHSSSGLRVDEDSLYRQFCNLFMHLRMPLFTFLSGFVYAYRPVGRADAASFARKKLIRLVLPLLCVSTLYFLSTFAAPEATGRLPWQEAWRIYVFPYVHFWFLQAIILIFALVVALEALQLLTRVRTYMAVLIFFMALHLYVPQENADNVIFSVVHAVYLAPFFLLGLGANRFRSAFLKPTLAWIIAACFLGAMTLHALTLAADGQIAERGSVLGLLIGVAGTLTLIYLFPHVRTLELLGAYSFTVYLFHPFFVAASRAALKVAQITSTELGFAVGLAAGVLGPVALERVLQRSTLLRRLLLGQR